LDHCPAHPSADVLKTKGGKIKAMFLPTNTTALIRPMDQGNIQAHKAYYRGELLGGVVNSDLQVTEFLKTLTLKGIAYSAGFAWGKITPTTIANCWKKFIGNHDVTVDETKLIPFLKQVVKAACDALGTNLQADDLASWSEVDEETPASQHLGKEGIASSVKDGNKTDELGASDSGSDSEYNGDDSCEVLVPKLSKVLEIINEVMTWLEQQTDS
jgi:hypothetical protein